MEIFAFLFKAKIEKIHMNKKVVDLYFILVYEISEHCDQ